jgi:hypothetical protein
MDPASTLIALSMDTSCRGLGLTTAVRSTFYYKSLYEQRVHNCNDEYCLVLKTLGPRVQSSRGESPN